MIFYDYVDLDNDNTLSIQNSKLCYNNYPLLLADEINSSNIKTTTIVKIPKNGNLYITSNNLTLTLESEV